MDEFVDCPHCGAESYRDEFTAARGHCPTCGHYHEELDMARHHSARTSLRTAAINFLADQNVTDRAELLFRARRHAELQVGQLTRPQADAVVREFCAAVDAELAHTPPARPARPSARTSAIVPDFADELLF